MLKPLPILSQMPWHIQQNIIESADIETKFSVRQCSKQLQSTVDQSKMQLDSLGFFLEWDGVFCKEKIWVGHSSQGSISSVSFYPRPNGFLQETQDKNSDEDIQKFVENGDYVNAGIEKFVKVLRRFPKLSVDQMIINFKTHGADPEGFESLKRTVEEKLNEALSSLNRKILARTVQMTSNASADGVAQLLSHFRPGTLQKIYLQPCEILKESRETVQSMNLHEIAELEHWKRAESFSLYGFHLELPLERTAHFNDFKYYCSVLTLEVAKYILNNMLRRNGWSSREVSTDHMEYETLIQHFSQFASTLTPGFLGGRLFRVRRGEFECQVFIGNSKQLVKFSTF